jgi:hypothetical protein
MTIKIWWSCHCEKIFSSYYTLLLFFFMTNMTIKKYILYIFLYVYGTFRILMSCQSLAQRASVELTEFASQTPAVHRTGFICRFAHDAYDA